MEKNAKQALEKCISMQKLEQTFEADDLRDVVPGQKVTAESGATGGSSEEPSA